MSATSTEEFGHALNRLLAWVMPTTSAAPQTAMPIWVRRNGARAALDPGLLVDDVEELRRL
jgi:hypothetical protein